MNRDELKEKIAKGVAKFHWGKSRAGGFWKDEFWENQLKLHHQREDGNFFIKECFELAEAALSVLEDAGVNLCQATAVASIDTVSASPLQTDICVKDKISDVLYCPGADDVSIPVLTAEDNYIKALNERDKYGVVVSRLVAWFGNEFCTHPFEIADFQAVMMDAELMDRETYQLSECASKLFSVARKPD